MPKEQKNDPIKFRTFLVSIETQTSRGARYAIAMMVLFGVIAVVVIWGLAMNAPQGVLDWLIASTLGR